MTKVAYVLPSILTCILSFTSMNIINSIQLIHFSNHFFLCISMRESVKQTKQLQARRQNTDTFTLTYAYVLFLYVVVYFVCV